MKIFPRFITSLNKEIVYYVGENQADNFDLLDFADKQDLWFHVDSLSSCHVVAKVAGLKFDKKQMRQVVTQGALLCKENSVYTYMSNLAIIYTYVEYVTKTQTMGRVSTTNAKIKII